MPVAAEREAPTLDEIRETRARLGDLIALTPVRLWDDEALKRIVGSRTQAFLKEELFQRTGSFKPRGALSRSCRPCRLPPSRGA